MEDRNQLHVRTFWSTWSTCVKGTPQLVHVAGNEEISSSHKSWLELVLQMSVFHCFMDLPESLRSLVLSKQRCLRTEACTRCVSTELRDTMSDRRYEELRNQEADGEAIDFFPVIRAGQRIQGWDMQQRWRPDFPELDFVSGVVPGQWEHYLVASDRGLLLFMHGMLTAVVCNPLLGESATVDVVDPTGRLEVARPIINGYMRNLYLNAFLLSAAREDPKTLRARGFSLLAFMVPVDEGAKRAGKFTVCRMESSNRDAGFVPVTGGEYEMLPAPPSSGECVLINGVIFVVRVSEAQPDFGRVESLADRTTITSFNIEQGAWSEGPAQFLLSEGTDRGIHDETKSQLLNVGDQVWLFQAVVYSPTRRRGIRVCYRLSRLVDARRRLFEQVGRDFVLPASLTEAERSGLLPDILSVAASSRKVVVLQQRESLYYIGGNPPRVSLFLEFHVAEMRWQRIGLRSQTVRDMTSSGKIIYLFESAFQISRAKLG